MDKMRNSIACHYLFWAPGQLQCEPHLGFVSVNVNSIVMPVLFVCWLLLASASADDESVPLKQIGKLPETIREASGLCKSRQHNGVFWTISDSGNSPDLYAITREGKLLAEYAVRDAINLDWESIDTDEHGNLWIGDIGNNVPGGPLKTRWTYQVREPNPYEEVATTPSELPQRRSVPIVKQWHFTFPTEPMDLEGLFVRERSVYLVGKQRQSPTPLFRMRLGEVAETKALKKPETLKSRPLPIKLEEIASLPLGLRVTGVALDLRASRLALCSYDHVTVIELGQGLKSLNDLANCPRHTVRFKTTDIEGCEWDGDDILLVSEDRSIYCLQFPKQAELSRPTK